MGGRNRRRLLSLGLLLALAPFSASAREVWISMSPKQHGGPIALRR